MDGNSRGRPEDREGRVRGLAALVAELGSVSEACRRLGLDRSAWYRLRKSAGAGWAGPGARKGPASFPDPGELERCVEGLAVRHPEWGCDRIAHYLALQGRPVSSPTVQKALIRLGLGRAAARAAEAARRRAAGGNG